jgi:hypothetical protein
MDKVLMLLLKALQVARLGNDLVTTLKPTVDALLKKGDLTPDEEAAYRQAYTEYRETSPQTLQEPQWRVDPDPLTPDVPPTG